MQNTLDEKLIEGGVLLTVNRRLARSLQREFLENRISHGAVVWETPNILPLSAWFRSIYSELLATGRETRQLLDAEQELVVWQNVLERSELTMLSVSGTANGLASARKTELAYSPKLDVDRAMQGDDQKQFSRWSEAYTAELTKNGWIDDADLPDVLFDSAGMLLQEGFVPATLTLAGFTELSPQHERFLERLEECGVVVDRHLLKAVAIAEPAIASGSTPRLSVCESSDADGETLSVALWARGLLEAASPNPVAAATSDRASHSASDVQASFDLQFDEDVVDEDAPKGEVSETPVIGVVIPDLHLRRHEVLRIFDKVFFPALTPADIQAAGRPYDISIGKPLLDWPIVDSALSILALGSSHLEGSELTRFVLSPYLGHANREQSTRAAFDRKLRKNGKHRMTIALLLQEEGLPSGLKRLLTKMQKLSLSRCRVTEWCQRFSNLLESAGWPGENSLDSAEHQCFEAWRELLRSAAKLDDMMEQIGARDMIRLLQRIARSRLFQPETPDLPIQIVGALESTGLEFDHLWVSGMDAGSWPPAQRPDPWLPLQWQKAAEVVGSTHESALAIADIAFTNWCVAAPDVVLSYASSKDGQDLSPSFAVAQLIESGVRKHDSGVAYNAAEMLAQALPLQTCDDWNGPQLDLDEPVRGGARLFEDQASCPFRAFALHRLSSQPLEEPGLGIDAREQGNAFHDAIEMFWKDVVNHDALLAMSDSELLEKISECVEAAIPDLQHQPASLVQLEKHRLVNSLLNWLTVHEKPRPGFEVTHTEHEEEAEFQELRFKLKVDRIDQLESGERVIIDYKTGGQNSPGKWMADRPTNAQLPLYATIVADIDGLCYAQVKRRENRFIGKASSKDLIAGLAGPAKMTDAGFGDTWEDNKAYWADRLGRLAEEIKQGHSMVSPQPGACNYCHLGTLCRVDPDTLESTDDTESSSESEGAPAHGRRTHHAAG